MSRSSIALAVAVTLALGARSAWAEGKSLLGQGPPDLGSGEWLASFTVELKPGTSSGPLVEPLKGDEVEVYYFFDTNLMECADQARVLEELSKKYKDQLRVTGVTEQKGDDVHSFVKSTGVKFPLRINAAGVFSALEVKAPQIYLINQRGKVVAEGPVGLDRIEAQLKDPTRRDEGGWPSSPLDTSPKFKAALKAMRAGEFSKAVSELAKLDKESGNEGERAKALEAWIEETGPKRVNDGDTARDSGDVFAARDAYASVEKRWPATSECVKTAKSRLQDLKSDKGSKRALAVEKDWNEACRAERAGDGKTAAASFRRCAAAGTGKFATLCEQRAQAALTKAK